MPTDLGHYARDRSLLDHFAGLAMQGMLADPEDIECKPGMTCAESVAAYAYEQAAEMIKEKRRRERM